MNAFLTPELLANLAALLSTILTIIIGSAATTARKRWNIEIEAKHREALHSAIMSGVNAFLATNADVSPEVERSAMKFAAGTVPDALKASVTGYVLRSVPDAIAFLSPLPDVLDNLIMSAIQQKLAGR